MECVLYRHLYINNIILFWPILTFTQFIKYQIVWSNSFQKFHLLNCPWFQILERWYICYHNNSHRRCHKVNRFCDKLHMEFLLKDCSYILLHSTVLLGLGLRSYLWAQNFYYSFSTSSVLVRNQLVFIFLFKNLTMYS